MIRDQGVNPGGTPIVFAAAGGDVLFTPTSLAAGAGRQSTVCDLESIYGVERPYLFRWVAFQKYTTAGVVGELTEIRLIYHEGAGATAHSDNDVGLTDAAFASEDKILGNELLGSIYCHDTTATVEAAAHGLVELWHPRFSIAWFNRNTNALSATAAQMGMIFTPVPTRSSDGSA